MPLGVVALERRRLVVARDQHALVAERLDPLVVAVHRAKARIDVHERAARHRQHHHRRVGVAVRILLRVEHARGARDDLDRLVGQEPAHHVEVVDHRVVEDAVRHRRDVVGRRDLRIAARQHQHLRPADLAGADRVEQRAMAGIEAPVEGDEERTSGRLAAPWRTHRRAPRSRSTGFSQNTALPARAARSMIAACVRGGVQIITAPTAGSASASSRFAVACAPCFAASLSRPRGRDRRPTRAAPPDARRCSRRAAGR